MMPSAALESQMCNSDLFDQDLERFCGFLLQCRLVFSQHACRFPSGTMKINYIIGLLQWRALEWVHVSGSRFLVNTLPFEALVRWFKRMFDWPHRAGCAGDR